MRAFEQRKKNNTSSSNFFDPKIQPKLKTGTVGDKYEVEADKVADKVVNKSSSNGLLQSKAEEEVQKKPISETISTVQKQEMKEEKDSVQKKEEEDKSVKKKEEEKDPIQKKDDKEEPVQKKEEEKDPVQKKEDKEEKVQAKCDNCGEEEKVQKKSDEEEKKVQAKNNKSQKQTSDNGIESRLSKSKGGGNKLDKKTKNEMESGFGTDFSNVKIHTDSNAIQMNQEIDAQAFTNGNDVYFNKGKYNPDSKEGKHLLAHELTHTIQQTGMVQKSAIKNENLPEDLQTEQPEFKNDTKLEKTNDEESLIRTGAKGEYVSKLQNGLMDLGYQLPNFGADGDFGSETRNAVVDFQNDNFLDTDGIVGSETIGTLDNILVELGGGNTNNCASTVPFDKDFTSQESVGFFSTSSCPNVLVTIKVTAFLVDSHFCSDLNVSIDHVKRTKRTIPIDNNGKGSFSETFTMKNHDKLHHLFFNMPQDCIGMGDRFNVKGTIKRI
jgi:Domain of unknown function (DUF4157)/Putative peptidoglycan binding domain